MANCREGSTNFGAYGDTLLLETIPGEGCGVGPTNFDFFLARYNLDGENEWITQSNGTDCSLGWGISQDGEGDLYFTGNYGGTVDFDFNDDDYFSTANNPDNDLYIVKMTKCSLDETTMFASACESYTTPSGDEVYTESGVYMDTLTNMCGCDSILSISLTISDPIDTELETEGGILTALETDANYQWINCKDSLPITGANEQTYYPMDGGSYAVIIEKGACTDTSDCISVGVHGILETNQNFTFNIYPNPTDGIVNLETTTDIALIITNSIGERITEYQVPEGKRVLDLHQYASGIYLLQITTQDGTMMNKKLILNN
jgi:hypothetical protein